MMSFSHSTRILVIGSQPYWRHISTQSLREAGFLVEEYDDYCMRFPKENIDLILLGCINVGCAELQLITHLLQEKHHLLVLSSYLSPSTMRLLYLQGVDEVVNQPYNSAVLVDLVQQVLGKVALHGMSIF